MRRSCGALPFVRLVDNEAAAQITYDLETALQMAAGINQAVASLLGEVSRRAQHKNPEIVSFSGRPI